MRYVKITKEQATELGTRKSGLTSGKKDKATGLRETIYFCSSLDFCSKFGYELEREFITI